MIRGALFPASALGSAAISLLIDGAAWIRACAARRTGTDESWLGTFRRSGIHSAICIGGDLRPVHQAAGGRTPGARFRRRDLPPPGSAARPARFRWSIALLVQRRRRFDTEAPALLLDPACLCSWCRMGRAFHPNATPQICSEIPPPVEWIFRAGIAYPIRAEMRGSGSGAERYCVFSTGAFVEPIQAWDEPHRLKFSVTSNPPPLEEWTSYAHIEVPRLHGFPRRPIPIDSAAQRRNPPARNNLVSPRTLASRILAALVRRHHLPHSPARPQAHSGRGGEEARLKDGEAPDPLRYRPLPPPAVPSQNDPHFPAFSPRYV